MSENKVDNQKQETKSADAIADTHTLEKKDLIIDQDISKNAEDDSIIDSEPVDQDVEQDKEGANLDDNKNWYIVQCLSNYELRVQTRIQQLIDAEKYKGRLLRVLVPMQQTVELKNNKRIEKNTKIFPGYVFIQMLFSDELAYELKDIPGIAKFVGIGAGASPVVEDEILKVLRKVGDKSKEIDVDFEINEVIKVIDGPFRGYTGTITEINPSRGNLKAKTSIFGRETPVELDFEQVEKTV